MGVNTAESIRGESNMDLASIVTLMVPFTGDSSQMTKKAVLVNITGKMVKGSLGTGATVNATA